MSIVTISVRVPSPDGTLVPAKGQLRWIPTRRRDVDGAVVIPHPFTVTLVDGNATVDVEPSTVEWAWQVDEYFSGIPSRTIHVAVPAVATAYTALTQVDPATLLPTAEPEAAWWAVANDNVISGAVVGDDLILTQFDGGTVNAGNVRGPAGSSGADGSGGLGISELIRPQWHHVYHVGSTRAYTTIQSAVTAARATSAGYARDGQGWDNGLLNVRGRGGRPAFYRSLIAVDPGTYTETTNLELGDGIDLIGLGASRDDVVIVNGTSNYNVRSYGSLYMANLTLHHAQGPTGNNYAFHGSKTAGISDITTVFDNVKFLDTNTGSTGIVGYDMSGGMMLFFNKCRFESTTGHSNILHDETEYNRGVTTVFLGCEADIDLIVDHSRVGKGQAWVIDCKTLAGVDRTSTVAIDLAAAQPTTARPPYPARGMTEMERHRYYPTKAKGTPALLTPKYPDLSAQTFTAGRIYYIPIAPADLDFSALVGKARINVVAPAGTVAAGLYLERPVDAGKPSSPLIYPAAVTAVGGQMEFNVATNWGPLFVDVGMRVWVGVRVNDATCQVLGSTQMSRVAQCWYEDGASETGMPTYPNTPAMVQVPAGVAVPWGAMLTA